MWEKETKDAGTVGGRELYWSFLNPRYASIFRTPLSTSASRSKEALSLRCSWCPTRLLSWLCCGSNWLPVTDRLMGYLCIISQNLFILRVVLPAVNPCNLLMPTHCLFSGNHFAYAAGTPCPVDPWLTKVNIQLEDISETNWMIKYN